MSTVTAWQLCQWNQTMNIKRYTKRDFIPMGYKLCQISYMKQSKVQSINSANQTQIKEQIQTRLKDYETETIKMNKMIWASKTYNPIKAHYYQISISNSLYCDLKNTSASVNTLKLWLDKTKVNTHVAMLGGSSVSGDRQLCVSSGSPCFIEQQRDRK